MDEKTEELRDIFTSVTDADTVTESQEEGRGSLAERDESTVQERLETVVANMRERYDFESVLSDDELIDLVRACYGTSSEDETSSESRGPHRPSDADLATRLGHAEATVFAGRMDLHLVGDEDLPDADPASLRECDGPEELAATLGVDRTTAERYDAALAARVRSRSANDRYRDEFEELLGERDLAQRLTEGVDEDGLEDATEGMETDVSM